MLILRVVFMDGSDNEWLCNDNEEAYSQLRRLKHVWGWEIIAATATSKHVGGANVTTCEENARSSSN